MTTPTRALLIDAGGPTAAVRMQLLRSAGHEVEPVEAELAARRLDEGDVDVIVLDQALGGPESLATIASAPGAAGVPIVVVMDDAAMRHAPAVLRNGGSDVIARSAGDHALVVAVERALRERRLRHELTLLRARADASVHRELVGRSSAMARVRELLARAAASRVTTLILGESGTGKNVVATLLHDLSDRSAHALVSVDCGGEPAVALERRLFGDAGMADDGCALHEARGGTLVIHDATQLPAKTQARLAEAVAATSMPRRGGSPADVRLVLTSRTSPDGSHAMLHDELLARFSALPITVPPLRERRSDIPLLVQHFRGRVAGAHRLALDPMSSEALLPLLGQEWEGNVRELEQWVERHALSASSPPHTTGSSDSLPGLDIASARVTLDQLERAYILHVLGQESGHQSRAAVRLGIDRRTLYRKLKQYRRDGPPMQQAG